MGTFNINTRLDVQKLLPKNSPLQEANNVVSNFGLLISFGIVALFSGISPCFYSPSDQFFSAAKII